MKKLIAVMCTAAALAVPVAPASASEIPPPAGTKRCPAPYTHGTIVWINTGPTGYHEEWFCFASGPGAATDSTIPSRAGVKFCGALGHYIVWYYDLDGDYQELWNSCI